MDKDLRDAFRALTLVRADLVATRQAKADVETQWRAFAVEQEQKYAQCEAQLHQLQETLAMRDEDFRTFVTTPRKWKMAQEPEQEDTESNGVSSLEVVAKDQIALLTSVYDQAEQLVAQESQLVQERSEWALRREALEHELAALHETQQDLVRENKFMHEKFDFLSVEVDVVKRERDALKLRLEAKGGDQARPASPTEDNQLQAERDAKDALQVMVEEQAAELERFRREREQRAVDNAKEQEEMQARVAQYELERSAWQKEKEILTKRVDDADASVNALERELEELQLTIQVKQNEIDGLGMDRATLIQQLQEIRDHAAAQVQEHKKLEEERMKTQHNEQEKLQHELTTLLASVEAATAEHAVKMSALQHRDDELERALAISQKKRDSLERVLSSCRQGLLLCSQDLATQRQVVLEHQHLVEEDLGVIQKTLLARIDREVVAAEVERRRLGQELALARDAACTLREELATVDTQRQEAVNSIKKLQQEVEQLKTSLSKHDEERLALQTAYALQTQEAIASATQLQQEVDQLKTLSSKYETLQTTHEQETTDLQFLIKRLEGDNQHREQLERQLQGLEHQLMCAEDSLPTKTKTSWAELRTEIRALDEFLPQLTLIAGRMQTSLQLCAENRRAMAVLGSPSLQADLASLVQLAHQWKRVVEFHNLSTHVRLVRRRVLATLAQWFEDDDDDDQPPPPFGLDSQEVAIVLEQWTSDTSEQKRVAQWLQGVATFGLADDVDDVTLELPRLTRDVKDAFRVLIVPLLRQNRHVTVRVFTRRVGDAALSYAPDETCWAMRLIAQRSHRHRSVSTSSTSSAASSLSLASSGSSAATLQRIHARLQQLQQNPSH